MLRTVVVVGGGLAGMRAAEALREEGFDGKVVVVGEERHLPYDRPPLSKQLLAGTWDIERLALREPEVVAALDIEWRLATPATAVDMAGRRVELEGGARLGFDGLVVATGAKPRSLPGVPALRGLFTLRTQEDSLALSAELEAGVRLVVVGAGFIGSEVAATARGRGAEVVLVDALPAPLAGVLGTEVGAICARLQESHGVEVRMSSGVASVEGRDRVEAVRLADGSLVGADVVLVGVGVAPETGWLDGSGLTVADGVVCDSFCFAAPGVVAAGDVARWRHPRLGDTRVEHWTNATEQAAAAARNLLTGPQAAIAYDPVPFFWSDQYDVRIQMIGHPRPDDRVAIVHGSAEEGRFVALYGRGGRLSGALGFSRPRQLMGYRRLLVAGASWDEALELA